MTTILKLPHIEECKVTADFDCAKGKTWVQLEFDGIPIKEYWPDGAENVPHKTVMDYIVLKCRKRLAIALVSREKQKRLREEAELRKMYLVK